MKNQAHVTLSLTGIATNESLWSCVHAYKDFIRRFGHTYEVSYGTGMAGADRIKTVRYFSASFGIIKQGL